MHNSLHTFKVYSLMRFSHSYTPKNHHQNQETEFYHPPGSSCPYNPSLLPLTTADLLSVTVSLYFLEFNQFQVSHQWNHTAYILLSDLVYSHYYHEIHPRNLAWFLFIAKSYPTLFSDLPLSLNILGQLALGQIARVQISTVPFTNKPQYVTPQTPVTTSVKLRSL